MDITSGKFQVLQHFILRILCVTHSHVAIHYHSDRRGSSWRCNSGGVSLWTDSLVTKNSVSFCDFQSLWVVSHISRSQLTKTHNSQNSLLPPRGKAEKRGVSFWSGGKELVSFCESHQPYCARKSRRHKINWQVAHLTDIDANDIRIFVLWHQEFTDMDLKIRDITLPDRANHFTTLHKPK